MNKYDEVFERDYNLALDGFYTGVLLRRERQIGKLKQSLQLQKGDQAAHTAHQIVVLKTELEQIQAIL